MTDQTINPNEVEIKPLPSWLKTVTPAGAWVTLAPFIFHPEGVKPEDHPAIIAHELTHIKQQTESGSVIRWVDRYFSDKEFRLQMEIEAIRAELKYIPLKDLAARIYGWGNMLAYSGPYMKAADSPEQVVDLLKDLYPGVLPAPGANRMTQEQFTAMVDWQTHGVDLKDPAPRYGPISVGPVAPLSESWDSQYGPDTWGDDDVCDRGRRPTKSYKSYTPSYRGRQWEPVVVNPDPDIPPIDLDLRGW